MLGKYTPKEENFMNLLHSIVKYTVPKFQREYSWKDEKVDVFWDDLIYTYEKAKLNPGNPDNQYYLGGMVLLQDETSNLILVDGQQRMATIMMLLCLVRDYLLKIAERPQSSSELRAHCNTNKSKIEQYIQIEKPDGSLDAYKLELNERNKNFFRRLVLTQGDPDMKIDSQYSTNNASEKLIFDCYKNLYKKLKKHIESIPEKEVPVELLTLINLSLEWISIISTTVKREEDAFDIFETLNQRGQKLAIGDLVKNILLKKTSTAKRDHVDNNWGDVLSNLGEDPNIDQFLRYSWFSRNFFKNGKLIKNKLFTVIKLNINNEEKVEVYVDELLEDSEIYQAYMDPTGYSSFWNNDREIKRTLSALRSLDAQYIVPTVITCYRMYKSNLSTFRDIIRLLLVYFFRFKIIGPGHANEVESTMVNLCRNLSGEDEDTGKPRTYSVDNIKSKLCSKVDNDDEFKKQFSGISIKKSQYAKYILIEIETILAGKRNDELEPIAKLTLEHIVPKNFDNWRNYFEDKKIENPEVLVHRLGNHTILTQKMNSKIRDSQFTNKLNKAYQKSHLELNKQTVCNQSEWTDKIIQSRQDKFAEHALKIWKF
jgi:uncharacterized protein with ParB-like and HNH nuclease domain